MFKLCDEERLVDDFLFPSVSSDTNSLMFGGTAFVTLTEPSLLIANKGNVQPSRFEWLPLINMKQTSDCLTCHKTAAVVIQLNEQLATVKCL